MVHVLTPSEKDTEISVEMGLSSKSAQFSASSPPSTPSGFRKGQISARTVLEPLRDPALLMWQRFRSPHCSPKGAVHAQSYQCKRENYRETDERLVDEHELKKRPLICQPCLLEQGKVKGGTSKNIITYLPAAINYKLLSLADSSEACRAGSKWKVAALLAR